MKKTFLIILIFNFLNVNCQEVKTKSNYEDPYKEKYSVLKSDKKVLHGKYSKFVEKELIIDGYYNNGLKDSIWTYYNGFGELLYSVDYNSQKIIDWNPNAKLIKKMWEQTKSDTYKGKWGKIVEMNITLKDYFKNPSSTEKSVRPPLFLDGIFVFEDILFESFINSYGSSFYINGGCMFSIIIDRNGNTKEIKALQESGYNFEDSFIDNLKNKSLKWIPAQFENGNIEYEIIIPLIVKTVPFGNQNGLRARILFGSFENLQYLESAGMMDMPTEYW